MCYSRWVLSLVTRLRDPHRKKGGVGYQYPRQRGFKHLLFAHNLTRCQHPASARWLSFSGHDIFVKSYVDDTASFCTRNTVSCNLPRLHERAAGTWRISVTQFFVSLRPSPRNQLDAIFTRLTTSLLFVCRIWSFLAILDGILGCLRLFQYGNV